MNFESAFQRFPSGFTQEFISDGSNTGYQGHSVFYFLLPYMEQNNLYDTMSFQFPKRNRAFTPNDGLAATVIPSLICPSDLLPTEPVPYPQSGTPSEFYGGTSYNANGGSRPIFATSATNDGVFMATGPDARKAFSAPEGVETEIGGIYDGTSNTILFGDFSHDDPNFDTFTAAGFNSGSRIDGWSRWYPAGGDNGLANLLSGAFAPINYRIPWAYGEPGAPSSQTSWYVYQDQRLSSFSSNHPGGANLGFADGSTRFLEEAISQDILRLYCRVDDGQVISAN